MRFGVTTVNVPSSLRPDCTTPAMSAANSPGRASGGSGIEHSARGGGAVPEKKRAEVAVLCAEVAVLCDENAIWTGHAKYFGVRSTGRLAHDPPNVMPVFAQPIYDGASDVLVC